MRQKPHVSDIYKKFINGPDPIHHRMARLLLQLFAAQKSRHFLCVFYLVVCKFQKGAFYYAGNC